MGEGREGEKRRERMGGGERRGARKGSTYVSCDCIYYKGCGHNIIHSTVQCLHHNNNTDSLNVWNYQL